MTRGDLLRILRRWKYAVEASVAPGGAPQAALVGVAVSDQLELFFDTLGSSRKAANLRKERRVAFVIGGWDPDERTVQYEGVADEPRGAELERLKKLYFEVFPD